MILRSAKLYHIQELQLLPVMKKVGIVKTWIRTRCSTSFVLCNSASLPRSKSVVDDPRDPAENYNEHDKISGVKGVNDEFSQILGQVHLGRMGVTEESAGFPPRRISPCYWIWSS